MSTIQKDEDKNLQSCWFQWLNPLLSNYILHDVYDIQPHLNSSQGHNYSVEGST